MSPSDPSPEGALAARLGAPMQEREPVFAEPWQAQAFALTLELSARGYFTWAEWAARLGEALKEAAGAAPPQRRGARDEGAQYYRCWVAALERLAAEKGLCDLTVAARAPARLERGLPAHASRQAGRALRPDD